MIEYIYGMRLRGFSIGCQPMDGFIQREDDRGEYKRKYHDLLIYNRLLTVKEADDYELDFLGEYDLNGVEMEGILP